MQEEDNNQKSTTNTETKEEKKNTLRKKDKICSKENESGKKNKQKMKTCKCLGNLREAVGKKVQKRGNNKSICFIILLL